MKSQKGGCTPSTRFWRKVRTRSYFSVCRGVVPLPTNGWTGRRMGELRKDERCGPVYTWILSSDNCRSKPPLTTIPSCNSTDITVVVSVWLQKFLSCHDGEFHLGSEVGVGVPGTPRGVYTSFPFGLPSESMSQRRNLPRPLWDRGDSVLFFLEMFIRVSSGSRRCRGQWGCPEVIMRSWNLPYCLLSRELPLYPEKPH